MKTSETPIYKQILASISEGIESGKYPRGAAIPSEPELCRAFDTTRMTVRRAIDALVGIDNVTRIVKVVGFVASAPGFSGQPGVINGASELLGEVFGEAGQHARSAVGVSELPLDAPVEVELIVEVA